MFIKPRPLESFFQNLGSKPKHLTLFLHLKSKKLIKYERQNTEKTQFDIGAEMKFGNGPENKNGLSLNDTEPSTM